MYICLTATSVMFDKEAVFNVNVTTCS